MKFTFSDEDSEKIHEVLGEEFWQQEWRSQQRRMLFIVVLVMFLVVLSIIYIW